MSDDSLFDAYLDSLLEEGLEGPLFKVLLSIDEDYEFLDNFPRGLTLASVGNFSDPDYYPILDKYGLEFRGIEDPFSTATFLMRLGISLQLLEDVPKFLNSESEVYRHLASFRLDKGI